MDCVKSVNIMMEETDIIKDQSEVGIYYANSK